MGKRSIAKFLAAVPLTASIAVNTPVSQNKNDIQLDYSQKNAKIILAVADNAETGKVKVNEGNSVDRDEKVSDEQLAAMEKMVNGYPIEKMIPYIAKRRPETAAFLVAIAKKESNWGKVSPKSKDGDCFNYWGFKDHRFPFAAGHSCFPSREAAIDSVGNRIDKLVAGGRNTPAKISIWKCGSACKSDGNVGKWISDVSAYFNPLMGAL